MASALWRTIWPVLVAWLVASGAARCRGNRKLIWLAAVLVALAAASTIAGNLHAGWRFVADRGWRWLGGARLVMGWAAVAWVAAVSVRPRARHAAWLVAALLLPICSGGPAALWWLGRDNAMANFADARGLVKQTTRSSCVPAASAMLLQRAGIRASEGQMAAVVGTVPRVGTDMAQMVTRLDGYLRRRGLGARGAVASLDRARRLGRPFLAELQLSPTLLHCVLVERVEADRVIVADPLLGRRYTWTRARFAEYWLGDCIWLEG